MRILERLMGRASGTARQPERGERDAAGDTGRTMGGRHPEAPVPPELPLDDDGNDARNIGG